MARTSTAASLARGLGGAVLGAWLGYALFVWLVGRDFYPLVLPGTMLGLGFGALSGRVSLRFGLLCAVLGAAMGIFAEWSLFPFAADDSLAFFVTHLQQLPPLTLGLIALGSLFAFWFGRGRERLATPTANEPSPDDKPRPDTLV